MLLHYPYYNAVETRGPGKILFSRKSGLKIARFPKIALLNDKKIFLKPKYQMLKIVQFAKLTS